MYLVTPTGPVSRRRMARADRAAEKPSWCGLYAISLSMLAMLALVETRAPAGAVRRALEVAIVLVAFGAIHLWVCCNRRALDLQEARDCGFRQVAESAAGGDVLRGATTPATTRGAAGTTSTRRFIHGG